MCFRLRFLLFENEERTSPCWLNTLSIATRAKAGKNITTVDKKTLRLLESYPWPGNIRELQNVIERSVIVCETENLSVDESWLSQQPLERENGEPALSLREGGSSRKGNHRSSSARMPRTGIRTVGRRREARDRAVHAGIENSVTQD